MKSNIFMFFSRIFKEFFFKIQEENHQTECSSSIITKKPDFIENRDGPRFSVYDQVRFSPFLIR